MREKFEIEGPDGRIYKIELGTDKKLFGLMNYLMVGLDYLSQEKEGIIKRHENPNTALLVGNLPCKRYTGKGYVYAAFREKINGQDTVVIDDSLEKPEIISQMTHEIIHGLYPHADENEIQIKTAKCLNKLIEDYGLITDPRNEKNFEEYDISSHTISKKDLEKSYEQLIKSAVYGLNEQNYEKFGLRKIKSKKISLEGIVRTFFGVCFIISFFFLSGITGNVIGVSHNNNSIGLILLFIALICFIFYVILKKKKSHPK